MGSRCKLCGASRTEKLFQAFDLNLHSTSKEFPINRCLDCGVGYTELPEDWDLSSAYPMAQYGPHLTESEQERLDWTFGHIVASRLAGSEEYDGWCIPQAGLEPYRQLARYCNRVLDLGCGSGLLLFRLKEMGWQSFGVEMSLRAAEVARSRGIEVQSSPVELASVPKSSVDVVVMNHSLEHFLQPKAALKLAYESLVPNGKLVVAVPNFDSPLARYFGPFWKGLDVPRHLFHFNPPSLTRLVASYGFKIERVCFDNSLGQILGSLRCMVRFRSAAQIPPAPVSGPFEVPNQIERRPQIGTLAHVALGGTYGLLFRLTNLESRVSMVVVARKLN